MRPSAGFAFETVPFLPNIDSGQLSKLILEPQSASRSAKHNSAKLCLARAAVLMLLLALAGFSTLAKNGQYFSKTSSARHVSLTAKMNLTNASPVINRALLEPVVKFIPSLPAIRAIRSERMSTPAIQWVCFAVSMQHRSPPVSLT
jgi:hypothetical protein